MEEIQRRPNHSYVLTRTVKLNIAVGLVFCVAFSRIFTIIHSTPKRYHEHESLNKNKRGNENLTVPIKLTQDTLQSCIDDYTAGGSWVGKKWLNRKNECNFEQLEDWELPSKFQNVTIGFMGDSTTRSDLRAFEERFKCPRTNLDEMQVFQKLKPDRSYVCALSEQSIDLKKCGIPPIVNVTDCRGASFRYFYKVYPWTALDIYYMDHPELFQDIDVLVISLGRWFPYANHGMDVTRDMDTFLVELKKVYTGKIIYQSEYAMRDVDAKDSKHPVNCTHGNCKDCWKSNKVQYECEQQITQERPQRDIQIRSVFEQHGFLYLDRWDISRTLPIEYFQLWYCGENGPDYHQWDCNHLLHFVALQHLRLLAKVLLKVL